MVGGRRNKRMVRRCDLCDQSLPERRRRAFCVQPTAKGDYMTPNLEYVALTKYMVQRDIFRYYH
jgi:hypothetical protein